MEAPTINRSIPLLCVQRRVEQTAVKQVREAVRKDNRELREKSALLVRPQLLQDLENRMDKIIYTTKFLEGLRKKHADIVLAKNKVRRKISRFRQQEQSGNAKDGASGR